MTRRSTMVVLCVGAALGGCTAESAGEHLGHDEAELSGDVRGAGERELVPIGERLEPRREGLGSFVALTQCGHAVCEGDEFCCNESCSICAPLVGGTCTKQLCDEPPILGEECGETTCEVGEVCCEPACGRCAVDLDACPEVPCDDLEVVPCGESHCAAGEVCCNESCGICAQIGDTCPLILCDAEPVLGPVCGQTACQLGQVCCDALCGICADEGAACPSLVVDCGPRGVTAR